MFLIAKIVRGRRLLHELEAAEKENERQRERDRDIEQHKETADGSTAAVASSSRAEWQQRGRLQAQPTLPSNDTPQTSTSGVSGDDDDRVFKSRHFRMAMEASLHCDDASEWEMMSEGLGVSSLGT